MKFTLAHMQQIKNWGLNFVKLVVWWTADLEPDENAPFVYNEKFIGYMNWIIDMAWDAGIYSIISVRVCYNPIEMPSWAGWSTHDYVVYNQVDSGGQRGLERFCNLWRMLVHRFDDHEGVIGYNPWMYPYHQESTPDGDERVDLYNNNVSPALISAIREKSDKIIFWSPVDCGARAYFDEQGYNPFGTGGYGVYPPHWNETRVPEPWDDKNIVYTFSEYGNHQVASNSERVWNYDVQRIEQNLSFGKWFQETYDVPMMTSEGPGIFIHNPENLDHPSNIRPIRQDRLDMLDEILNLFDDYPKNWAYWLYSGEKASWGVLENGVTLEESAIVAILKQHKAAILIGDLNNDGILDIKDLYFIAKIYEAKPEDPSWNPKADLNGDGKIGIKDLFLVAKKLGQEI